MAISLALSYAAGIQDGSNTPRVIAAAAIAAVAVLNENPATNNHANRLLWASKALLDPVSMGKKMVWGVIGDANVQAAGANPSDAIIQTSVNSLVDIFANA